jgi:hypothetical protein
MGIHVGLDTEEGWEEKSNFFIEKNNVDMSRYKKGNHNSDYERLLSFCGSIWGRKNKGKICVTY